MIEVKMMGEDRAAGRVGLVAGEGAGWYNPLEARNKP
jgi:hypothetical protein